MRTPAFRNRYCSHLVSGLSGPFQAKQEVAEGIYVSYGKEFELQGSCSVLSCTCIVISKSDSGSRRHRP